MDIEGNRRGGARANSGGAREGAGRPKVGDTKVNIRLSDEQALWLDELRGDATRSEFIRSLIEKTRSSIN